MDGNGVIRINQDEVEPSNLIERLQNIFKTAGVPRRSGSTARYQIRNDHLYAERVAVLPEYRRRGVSAALMKALEDVARKAGLPEIRLGVRASLPSNLRHYENLGYLAFDSSPHPPGSDWVIWLRKQV